MRSSVGKRSRVFWEKSLSAWWRSGRHVARSAANGAARIEMSVKSAEENDSSCL